MHGMQANPCRPLENSSMMNAAMEGPIARTSAPSPAYQGYQLKTKVSRKKMLT
jgi:hypothetical protein